MKELDSGYKDAQCYSRVPIRIWRAFLTMSILASHQETCTVFEGVLLPPKNMQPTTKHHAKNHSDLCMTECTSTTRSSHAYHGKLCMNLTVLELEHVVEGLTNFVDCRKSTHLKAHTQTSGRTKTMKQLGKFFWKGGGV